MSKQDPNMPIGDIDNKIQQLKKRKNDILKEMQYKSKQAYRKERARRLIETGALAEKYFEIEDLTIQEREELFKAFSLFVTSNKPKKFKKK